MICGIMASQGVASACAYPFTMTEAQAISLGYTGVLPVVGQSATYTVEGGLGTAKLMLTGSDLDAVQTIDTTTGIKAFRLRMVSPAITSVAVNGVVFTVAFADISTRLVVGMACSSTTRRSYVVVEGSTVFNSPGAPEINEFFAVFDSTASTIYIYNGASLVYSGAYTPRTDTRISMQAVEYSGLSAPDIGKEFTREVFTSATDIMAAPAVPAFPPGTTDICGNQIVYPHIRQSWAIVAIEPISPAGVPVAYRLQVRK